MNQQRAIFCTFCTIATLLAMPLMAADSPREHLSLDGGWKFHLGDDWPNALNLAKAGASTGPASDKFTDAGWRAVNVPHDWAVELPFDKKADESHGFKAVGPGFASNSVGWYRRSFELPAEDSGKRIWLTFDGVFRDATVWVNGWLVSRHEGGYYPFREDITDVVKFGSQNRITVRVDASKLEGWFYEGAGIYRHVWLDKTAPVAIAPEGIFVQTEFPGNVPKGEPEIKVEVKLLNAQPTPANAKVTCEVISPEGKAVAALSGSAGIERDATVWLKSKLPAPVLWSPESPTLYKLVTTVSVEGKAVDRKETAFGVRTIAFDPERGFLLNGAPYMLKGTCNHQDHAGVGVALPDALQSFRIARLKEFGSNAYRCSHNPPTPELLDTCDRLGMIVMDENRLLGSDSENLRKWEELIRRDRNHPSVCIWSVANEEFSVQATPQGGNAARAMQAVAKRLDPARPVTYAAPQSDTFDGINGVIEVRGWNYNLNTRMEDYHRKHPTQPNVLSEQASTVGTRGVYETDKARGYVSSYDTDRVPGWANSAEVWWSFLAARPWLSGGFVWTGFDYRGEPTPYRWPCINSHFGILDTCGFPKDNYFYYQAWWTNKPVLHLVPGHWNWPGKDGRELRVDALSNCKEVELFLNGKSQGRQTMKPNSKLTWKVNYEPGTLSAKGFDANGKAMAETKIETTGNPVAIRLTRDLTGLSSSVKADGEDLAIYTVSAVDAQGRPVPTAQQEINFSLEGEGKMIGVGNGDPSSHEPDVFLEPEARTIPVNGWRWKVGPHPSRPEDAEMNAAFDDSGWNTIKTKTDAAISDMPLQEHQEAVYRAHLKLTDEDLSAPGVRIQFGGCDDHGWYFVNGAFLGESHQWKDQPSFDIKKHLHPGDNIIVVGVKNDAGSGGMNPNVNVEISPKAATANWSRSLFNGLAQIIVQASQTPGKITLTAKADGLQPAAATIQTIPATLRPFAK